MNAKRVSQLKPLYRIPSMQEIAGVELNGLTVATTFSGIGGTDLGFAMAGFTGVFATDSDPAAETAFKANHPRVPFLHADVRTLRGGDIPDADILCGSPPCTDFSTAGPRKIGRKRAAHAGATDVCTTALFFEFVRLVDEKRPKVFVAENVAGLLKGWAAQRYAREIVRRLARSGYRVDDALLDAQWLGVPQRRQRVIIVGIREDLGLAPRFPEPGPYRYVVRDALPDVAVGEGWDFGAKRFLADEPAPTITASSQQSIEWLDANGNPLTFPGHLDLKRLCGFPDDFVLPVSRVEAKKRVGNSVVPPMAFAIASTLRDLLQCS